MIHTISTTPIYFSRDYKNFKIINGNRVINESKVKKIIQDIDNGLNMLKFAPIIVTKELEIIDGQHRFNVCKILKLPVYFVIADTITLSQIASINSRTKKWKPIDFVNCYVKCNNPDYVVLDEFINKYELPVSSALFILEVGIFGERSFKSKTHFEEGTFKVKHKADAVKVVEYAKRFTDFAGNVSGSFLAAIATLYKENKFNPEHLIEKHCANPDLLQPQSGRKGYLIKLEEIYNYKNSIRKTIF